MSGECFLHPAGISGKALAGLFLVLALTGCQTNAAFQDVAGAAAVTMGASTILSNLGAKVDPRVAGVAAGVTQMAGGMATLAASPNFRGSSRNSVSAEDGRLPDTPQCAEYLREASRRPSLLEPASASLRRVYALYVRCLDSDPDHPTSRRLRCRNGGYRGYHGVPGNLQQVCTPDQAVAAFQGWRP